VDNKTLLKLVEDLGILGDCLMSTIQEMRSAGPQGNLLSEAFVLLYQARLEKFLDYDSKLSSPRPIQVDPRFTQPTTTWKKERRKLEPIKPGDRFGQLVTVKTEGSNWQVMCEVCGNLAWFAAGRLRSRVNPTCGCKKLGEVRDGGYQPPRTAKPAHQFVNGKWQEVPLDLPVASDDELNEIDEDEPTR